eukprot:gnl/TRDRNA2_/TRDRNA2_29871_c0_seq1.p1 gnl/TRDRNA2_/TRDRNA2_29871_c0~~gnl/TRDRNA2_/TRDRNA2_29871_c0_seq1.p1  ORF type:complete len:142 (-),score=30.78 gnl/TRDRNA2_/TRDRNA2_29871_c0_seq1:55-444(-)
MGTKQADASESRAKRQKTELHDQVGALPAGFFEGSIPKLLKQQEPEGDTKISKTATELLDRQLRETFELIAAEAIAMARAEGPSAAVSDSHVRAAINTALPPELSLDTSALGDAALARAALARATQWRL